MPPCTDAVLTTGAETVPGVAVPTNAETILVTGGCGFIGSHTAKELLNRGYRVVVVDEMNDYYDVRIKQRNLRELQAWEAGSGFVFYEGDLGDEKFVNTVFDLERPAYVCHLAARAGVRASLDDPRVYAHTNIVGTTNILEMSRRYGVRSVAMASSSSVYGDRKKDDDEEQDEDAIAEDGEPVHAFRETDPVVRPASPYAATKAGTELIAYTFTALYNLPIACLRFFTVYGPGGRPDMAPFKFVDRISNGLQIDRYGDGSAVRDFTYVTDIVDGTLLSMFKPQGFQIYNLGGGNPVTLAYFITLIEKGLETKANIRELPPQPGDVGRTHASVRKAKDQLGFEAKVKIEDGIMRTIEWYRDFQAELKREKDEQDDSGSESEASSASTKSYIPTSHSMTGLEFEGSIPEPKFAANSTGGILICTRVHNQTKLTEEQKVQLTQLLDTALEVENGMAAIAVEWTPLCMTLLDDVNALVNSYAKGQSALRHHIKVIPVANWGITTALNACLHEAGRLSAHYIAFCSVEIAVTPETLGFIRSHVDEETLVAGAALPGHKWTGGLHTLDGTNCPWNALAVWRVATLSMTGFVAIGNGSLAGTHAGVEEVSTVTVIQQLRTASGSKDAQAKLLRVPGVSWETDWADEGRKITHQLKMASKNERAATHLEMLQLNGAVVSHILGVF